MVERNRVGLVYSYNENWIAGAYYILNIIHALNTIEDSKKPMVVILTETLDNFYKVKEETAYPYLEYFKYPLEKITYTLPERVINKLARTFFKKTIIVKKHTTELDVAFLYPNEIPGLSKGLKKVNWIPDFQEDYLPHLFSETEVEKRKKRQKEVYAKGDIVVLSSEDAKSDFLRLYPDADAETFVLPFAVTHPDFSHESIEVLREDYNLPVVYFFAPNQFWAHKNHILVLKAVKYLKDKGLEIVVAMSGNENDYRNKDNFSQLKDYILTHKLESNIKLLGFLPRTKQLCIFKNAKAIIQPSLFEGWSTVVEDSKALGKYMIASSINVHKEQIKENVSFFDPQNELELAGCIETYLVKSGKIVDLNYNNSIFEFGSNFNKLIQIGLPE
ncbi:MAG: glycosyltransferase family 4 protein [Ignavibacteriae bacterium]|nr:glycosyltransferase family 4 protein [Ignavibacteriota bacterium]MCB0752713.1 glycosyltransferase family 4 protein [Ignavibacteriota bacterium]HPF97440.1 glycosyltransferase family 1 protein [Mangrovimonas sp.]